MKFKDRPDPALIRRPLKVVRVKPGEPLRVVHLCRVIVGLDTHWFGGSTIACTQTECKACDRDVPIVWKGFVPVGKMSDPTHQALLQITPNVIGTLEQYQLATLGYLGLEVVYERSGSRLNSPLKCKCYSRQAVTETFDRKRVVEIVQALFRVNGRLAMVE